MCCAWPPHTPNFSVDSNASHQSAAIVEISPHFYKLRCAPIRGIIIQIRGTGMPYVCTAFIFTTRDPLEQHLCQKHDMLQPNCRELRMSVYLSNRDPLKQQVSQTPDMLQPICRHLRVTRQLLDMFLACVALHRGQETWHATFTD